MLEIADLNCIKCLDMWHTLGINANNYLDYRFDPKHADAAGSVPRGEAAAVFIKSNYHAPFANDGEREPGKS
jgi:hypothetical protein